MSEEEKGRSFADYKRGDRDKKDFKPREQREPREFQRREYQKKDPEDIIYGIRAVTEAVNAGTELNKILIQKGMEKQLFEELKEALKGKDYQLQFVPAAKLNSITRNNHQGVIAFTSPVAYGNIEALADQWLSEGKEPCILVLDRITDVRNFGGIARTAACMGVDAILLPSQGSVMVNGDAIKTSAGALTKIPVCKSDSLKNALFYLQQSGFQVVSCSEKGKSIVTDYQFFGPTVIIMGSEENGVSYDLLKMSDAKLAIPMAGEISSLNVGVAAGMILYERLRQLKALKK